MLALTGAALTGCGNSTSGEGSDKGSKLAAIKSRGHLNAGVKKDVPGYGYYDTAKGRFEGMEVDLCYQIAAAVFGVSYKGGPRPGACRVYRRNAQDARPADR